MTINKISIQNFRNLKSTQLTFSNDTNLILGDNGSGKSSFLESLYFLGRGKSFRTTKNNLLIELSNNNFLLFANIGKKDKIGVQKYKNKKLQIKVNKEKLYQLSTLSTFLALQIITPESLQIIESGPTARRKFIDWLVFHVKHNLISTWKKHRKILQQRNSSLKNKRPIDEIVIWDRELAKLSNILTEERFYYIKEINKELEHYTPSLFNEGLKIHLNYQRGWNDKHSLEEVLKQSLSSDIKRGHTQHGLNKSDIKIMVNINNKDDVEVKEFFSKGNKKLLAILLILIQTKILVKHKNNFDDIKPILLVDDLFSELDSSNIKKIIPIIFSLNLQTFLTGISKYNFKSHDFDLLNNFDKKKEIKLFHVEQGTILEKSLDDI